MESVTLNPFYHRGEECIGIFFNPSRTLTAIVKKIPRAKWSRTHQCWYISCTKEHYLHLSNALQNKVTIQKDALRIYLQKRKAIVPPQQKVSAQQKKIRSSSAKMMILYPLSKENLAALAAFKNMLTLKAYSANTIRNYCNEFHHLLRLLGKRSVNDLNKQQIMSYLLWLIEKQGYSEMHVHIAINAIKFYFEQVMKRNREFYDLPRPKKPIKLPSVLAEEEVISLVQKIENIKHRAIILAGYSAGMRVSEIINLKVNDIDSKRMMIRIKAAKGKKDRMVPLSKRLLETLRDYYRQYKPKEYLFEGRTGESYSSRSIQLILSDAKLKAKVKKKGSTDMLKHNSIKTTMRYTHVSRKSLDKVESPLDKLKW
jgi:integrase/recombinase XerD